MNDIHFANSLNFSAARILHYIRYKASKRLANAHFRGKGLTSQECGYRLYIKIV